MPTELEKNVLDRVLVLEMVRVTEAAAIAAATLVGRGDEKAADAAAVEAHRGFEHFKRLGRAMGPFLDGVPVVTRMDKVS